MNTKVKHIDWDTIKKVSLEDNRKIELMDKFHTTVAIVTNMGRVPIVRPALDKQLLTTFGSCLELEAIKRWRRQTALK